MRNTSSNITFLFLVGVAFFFVGCSMTTPLMNAAKMGDTKEMERLIGAGAQLEESVLKNDYTALHYAVYKGQVEAARLLIEKGAIVDKKAKFWGDNGMSHWMCDCTPLYLAVLNGDANMVALLLEKGAIPDKPVVAGNETTTTPFKTSQEQGNIVVAEMFRKAAGKMLAKYAPAAVAAPPAPTVSEITSDVDELPAVKVKHNKNSYAIVIGIEQYRQKLPKADFATQDAKLVANYLTKALGYPEENVITLLNDHASNVDLAKYFEKWLPNNVEKDSTVFVYYSGHGAPDPKSGSAYLVPYDGDPSFIDETGYSLKRMYSALSKLPAKEVIVALDSCFSGAGGRSVLAKGARPLVMNLNASAVLPINMTVLSASSGDQISSTYDEKGHGLFTYFMLKGIKNEDVTKPDGSLKLDDLYSYVKPQVERIARKQYNNEQSPQLIEGKKN